MIKIKILITLVYYKPVRLKNPRLQLYLRIIFFSRLVIYKKSEMFVSSQLEVIADDMI